MNAQSNTQTRTTHQNSHRSFEDRQRAGEARGGAGGRPFRWLKRLEDEFDQWLRGLTAAALLRRSTRWRRWLGLERLEERCVLASPAVSVLPIALKEGLTFNGVVANVTDPGNNEPATDYSALINWGDGGSASTAALSGPTGGPFTVSGSHTYAQMGQYSLRVSVTNNALADTWTTETSMPTASEYPAAAAAANGLLYVFGGFNSSGQLNTVQAYNPVTNAWTTEAPMPTASDYLAATAGANGLLYVFGGYNGTSQITTVQAYNPATNTWTTEAPMPTASAGLAAAAGANGLIYVFGGYNPTSGVLNTVQVYNPAANSWTTAAPMPTASAELAAAASANGLLYVFGGYNSSNLALNTVQAYNPTTNTWTTVASMPTASDGPAAAAGANGQLYVFGGINSNIALSTVQAYNPSTNTWTSAAPMPTASYNLAAAAGANGLLYAFGGFNSTSGYLNTAQGLNTNTGSGSTPIEVIDQAPVVSGLKIVAGAGTPFSGAVATFTDPGGAEPAANYSASINWGDGTVSGSSSISYNSGTGVFTVYGSHTYTATNSSLIVTATVTDDGGVAGAGTWTTVASMPTPSSYLTATAGANGLLYAFGGTNNNNSTYLNTVQGYNSSTNTWTTEAPMPTANAYAAAVAGGNGLIYVLGGFNPFVGALNTVQVYNPSTNTWTTAASMPTATYGEGAAVGANGLLYVFGGAGVSGTLNTVQAYNPSTNTWTTAAPMPNAFLYMAAAAGSNGLLYVVGGQDQENGNIDVLNTVYAYNPATNTWTTEASMPTASDQPAAVVGDNGLLYVLGGYNGSWLNTAQVYNPATNSWSNATGMPVASGGLAAAVGANNRLYVFGGNTSANPSNGINTVQLYQAIGASGSGSAAVVNATPLVSVLPISPQEGLTFNGVVADVSDPGDSEPATAYTATINWGDGSGATSAALSGPTGGPFTISGSHTYAQMGQYGPTVSVTNNALANTWTTEANMPTASEELASASGANGLIYVFGGYNGSYLNTVQAYNPSTNTWTTEAPMPTATESAAAATGANGLIYVFGGFNSTNGDLNTVQAYNPVTNTWTTEAPMPTANFGLAAATGPNGLIYVFGGALSSNTVRAYNPSTNTWTTEASMPTASFDLAAATGANGLIYVFGGYNGSYLNTVQAYNPSTNTWTTAASMPTASAQLAAAAGANGLLYVFGGFNNTSLNTVQAYNPSTNTWTSAAPMPTASYNLAAAAGANGLLYVFGGFNSTGSYLNTVQALNTATGSGSTPIEVIDQAPVVRGLKIAPQAGTPFSGAVATFTDPGGAEPAANYSVSINWGDGTVSGSSSISYNSGTGVFTVYGSHTYTATNSSLIVTATVTDDGGGAGAGTWTTVASMPTPSSYLTATAGANGLLYVFGGTNNSNSTTLNTVQGYNPSTNTWTSEAPMPTANAYAAAVAGGNGLIYVFGGFNPSVGGALNTVQVYNPATNTWTTAASMPTATYGEGAAVGANGLLYVFGGAGTSSTLNTVQAYNPATNTWTTAAPMPNAFLYMAAAAGSNGLLYVFGGQDSSGTPLNKVYAYNPATNTWTTEANMPTASDQPAAVAGDNGLLYVLGGYNGSWLNTAQVYNPATNSWSNATGMPVASGGLAAAVGANNRLYVFGGNTSANPSNGINTVQLYQAIGASGSGSAAVGNAAPVVSVLPIAPQEGLAFSGVVANVTDPGDNEPAADYSAVINWGDGSSATTASLSGPTGGPFTVSGSHTYPQTGQYGLTVSVSNNALADTWTTVASLPTATDGSSAAAGANGLLYVFGANNSNGLSNTVQAYNPATNTWSNAAPMPTASYLSAAAAGTNGLLYVFGGLSSSGSYLNTVQAYNPATNTWATEVPMPTATWDSAAAAGANGLLYVFGGSNGSTITNIVQAYNPATNTWTTEASMPAINAGAAAVAGANGLLYVFGGSGSVGTLNTVQAYNPATNTWTIAANMPTASDDLAAAAGSNGLLYVFGGQNQTNFILNTVQAYNPLTNTWTTAAPMPTATQAEAAAAGANGLLYVFGGVNSSGASINTVQAFNINTGSGSTPIEVIDQAPVVSALPIASLATTPFSGAVATFTDPGGAEPAANYSASINWGDGTVTGSSSIGYNAGTGVFTVYGSHTYAAIGNDTLTVTVTDDGGVIGAGTWTTVASMPTPSSYLTAAAGANGLLYVFGGTNNNNSTTLNTVQGYNPSTNTWTTEAPMPTANAYAAAVAGGNGLIYVFGGFNPSVGGALNTVQVYNPATNTWTTAASMPTAVYGEGAAVGANGLLYVFGGNGLNIVQAYNPATNTWATEANMPTAAIYTAAAAVSNGLLYVFGGQDEVNGNINVLNTVQAYNPATNTWTIEASMPTASDQPAAVAGDNGLLYVFGGYNGSWLNTAQVYNPATNSWSSAAGMPTASGGLAAAVGANNRLYVFGGNTSANPSNGISTVQLYQATGASGSGSAMVNGAGLPTAIVATSGSGQSANVNKPFINPLVVTVTNALGNPVPNVTVTFAGPNSGTGLGLNGDATVTTNAQGQASFIATADAVEGSYVITATVAGVSGVASFTLTNTTTSASSPPQGSYSPQQIQQAYGFDSIGFANGVVGNGAGQTIAIVVAYNQPNILSDLQAFDQHYGLPNFNQPGLPTFTVAAPQGLVNAPVGDWGIEASLDVEWAHALAPYANILLVEADAPTTDLFSAVDYARQQPNVSVISMSWGKAESALSDEASFDRYFTTPAGHTPETFIASTGDLGVGEYPAFSPNVLAVGGTAFAATLDANGDYPGEVAWNNSGGGVSQYESQPNFQTALVTQSSTFRTTPDVSFDAGSDVAVYDSYDFGSASPWIADGGTSLGAPAWAALIAIADQGSTLVGTGNLNGSAVATTLYNIAVSSDTLGFNVITSGINSSSASSSYNLITGLGTPKAPALVAALSGNIGVPTLLTPSGLQFVPAPTFQWSAVPGALGYQLVVVDQTVGVTVLNVNVTGTTYTPNGTPFSNTDTYQWSVRAYLVLGGLGASSSPAVFSFNPGNLTLKSPANGQVVSVSGPVTFTWSLSATATFYDLTLVDETQGSLVLSNVQVTGNTYTPSITLVSGHAYQWYLQAYSVQGNETVPVAFSNPATFYGGQSQGTTLLAPAANGTDSTTNTPTFQWSAVTGASGYEFSLFDVTANQSLIADLTTSSLAYTPAAPLTNNDTYEWSVSIAGQPGSATATSFFIVSVPSQGRGSIAPPILTAPKGVITTNQPVFQWQPVPGATGYGLYIFHDGMSAPSIAGGPIQLSGNGDTSYVAPPLLNLAAPPSSLTPSFLWYVVAYDNNGNVSEPSTALTFNVALTGLGSATPTGTGPVGMDTTTYTPTFQWSPASGNSSYTLDIYDVTNNTTVFDQNVGGATSYTLGYDTVALVGGGTKQVAQLINGHTYQWYVEAVGSTSPYYGQASFKTFTVSIPSSNTLRIVSPTVVAPDVNTLKPTFVWTPVAGATYYVLSISGLSPIAITASGTGNESYTLTVPLENGGTYQWQVASYINNIPGSAVTPQAFIVDVPGTPVMESPISGTTGSVTPSSLTPSFQWSSVPGAAYYELFVRDATNNNLVVNGLRVGGASYTLNTPLVSGSYQWYVLAVDSSGDVSPLALETPQSFVALGTPLLSGISGMGLTGTVNSDTATLQWTPVTGATGYDVTLLDTTTMSTPTITMVNNGSTTLALTQLVSGDDYQWKVAAVDSALIVNNAPVFSAASAFTGVPYSPAYEAPTPTLSPTTATDPAFAWSGVSVPNVLYQLSVTDVTGGESQVVIPARITSGTSYTASGLTLMAGHNYEWQVTAVYSLGGEGSSALISFTVGSPPSFPNSDPTTFTFVEGIYNSFPVTVNGTPPITFSDNGPSGVTFANGTLSGTPTVYGIYSDTFMAANVVGSATLPVTVVVDVLPTIAVPTTETYEVGTAITPFQVVVVTAGFPSPSLRYGGNLDGLNFDTGSGELSGTPTVIGTFSGTFTASNSAGNATRPFTLIVINPPVGDPIVNQPNPPPVADGSSESFTIPAIAPVSGGAPLPLTFSLGVGAPAGMTINAQTGSVTFAPSEWNGQAPGVYTATVTVAVVTNPQASASESFSVTVGPSSTAQGSGIMAREAAALGFTQSTEYYSNFITAAYNKYLNRGPDAIGLAYWLNLMQNQGLSDERLEAGFIGSTEYIADHGGAGQGWVVGMYENLLGRTPAPSEVQYWLTQLAAGESTADIAYGFAASKERESDRVAADYQQYLGRSAPPSEFQYWVNIFLNGGSNEQVIGGFLGSQEYFQDHGNNIVDWIFAAYHAVLNRLPDQGGLQYWENQLQ